MKKTKEQVREGKSALRDSSVYSRRDFLTWLTGLSLGITSFFTGAVLAKFSLPPPRSLDGKIKVGWLPVAKTKELVEGKPKLVKYAEDWVYLVKTASKIRAYNAACPHVRCKVKWNEETRKFDCPCHGSSFTINGKRLGGPAPRDMFAMKMEIKGGLIWTGGIEEATGGAR